MIHAHVQILMLGASLMALGVVMVSPEGWSAFQKNIKPLHTHTSFKSVPASSLEVLPPASKAVSPPAADVSVASDVSQDILKATENITNATEDITKAPEHLINAVKDTIKEAFSPVDASKTPLKLQETSKNLHKSAQKTLASVLSSPKTLEAHVHEQLPHIKPLVKEALQKTLDAKSVEDVVKIWKDAAPSIAKTFVPPADQIPPADAAQTNAPTDLQQAAQPLVTFLLKTFMG